MSPTTVATRLAVSGTAAAVLLTTATGVAAARPGHGDVECTTTLRNVTVRGNLNVPHNATCTLDRVKVTGNLNTFGGSTTSVADSVIRGNVNTEGKDPERPTPRSAKATLTNTRVNGTTTVGVATHADITGGRFGAIVVDGYFGRLELDNAVTDSIQADGDADLKVTGSLVRGSLSTGKHNMVKDTVVRGSSTFTGWSVTSCNNRFADVTVLSYYGATFGDGSQCAGNVIRGDLTIDTLMRLRFYNNTVRGDVNITQYVSQVEGSGNRFLGAVPDALSGTGRGRPRA